MPTRRSQMTAQLKRRLEAANRRRRLNEAHDDAFLAYGRAVPGDDPEEQAAEIAAFRELHPRIMLEDDPTCETSGYVMFCVPLGRLIGDDRWERHVVGPCACVNCGYRCLVIIAEASPCYDPETGALDMLECSKCEKLTLCSE